MEKKELTTEQEADLIIKKLKTVPIRLSREDEILAEFSRIIAQEIDNEILNELTRLTKGVT